MPCGAGARAVPCPVRRRGQRRGRGRNATLDSPSLTTWTAYRSHRLLHRRDRFLEPDVILCSAEALPLELEQPPDIKGNARRADRAAERPIPVHTFHVDGDRTFGGSVSPS